ncbi:MAG: hypothetical protein HY900_31305, partial [Deltaproteobacteria bacterium]|nr:hypothetical protein [Deltaproteobacteria bacterium]
MRRATGEKKPGTVLAEVPALDGVVEVTAAWVQDKHERFPHADVLAVVEAYRARCAADPAERVTVWGMERQLTRLIR